jgi:hypothetical protein
MIFSFCIISLVCALAVIVHYQTFVYLSSHSTLLSKKPRMRIIYAVYGAMLAHIVEVWLFALIYYYLLDDGNFGELIGSFDGSFLDCIYFSFSAYTSLGFGDIVPMGYFRFLAGLEALTGLVLISWTASFVFVEMQKNWRQG